MRLFSKIIQVFKRQESIDWDDLEAMLIRGDLGVRYSSELVELLRDKTNGGIEDVMTMAREEIRKHLPAPRPPLLPLPDGLTTVILMVGVNGSGKTTSSAKLGAMLQRQGYSVMLAAADTFRAAAVEQLEVWDNASTFPSSKARTGRILPPSAMRPAGSRASKAHNFSSSTPPAASTPAIT